MTQVDSDQGSWRVGTTHVGTPRTTFRQYDDLVDHRDTLGGRQPMAPGEAVGKTELRLMTSAV
jgi:hypothetical protein